MVINVKESSSYKYLTEDGTKPVKLNYGFCEIDEKLLADHANAICTMLCGKGLNYYQISLILDTAKDAFRETKLLKPF